MPPPKRGNKRRSEDQGSSKPPKKLGKRKTEPTYDTYDDAMDGGVEMEEKGERYRDGDKVGEKYEHRLITGSKILRESSGPVQEGV